MILPLCSVSSNESDKNKTNDSNDLSLKKNTPSSCNNKFADSGFISMLVSKVEATKAYGAIKKINCYPDKIVIEYCGSQLGEKVNIVSFSNEGFDQNLSVEDCRLYWRALAQAAGMEESICRYQIPYTIPYSEWNEIVDKRQNRIQAQYHVSGFLIGDIAPKINGVSMMQSPTVKSSFLNMLADKVKDAQMQGEIKIIHCCSDKIIIELFSRNSGEQAIVVYFLAEGFQELLDIKEEQIFLDALAEKLQMRKASSKLEPPNNYSNAEWFQVFNQCERSLQTRYGVFGFLFGSICP